MAVPNKYRADLDTEKHRVIGSGADEVGVATLIHGQTSAGLNLPIKVVDDGSNRGKIVTSIE